MSHTLKRGRQAQQDKLFRGEAGGDTPRPVTLLTDGFRFGAAACTPRGFCESSLLLLLARLPVLTCTGETEVARLARRSPSPVWLARLLLSALLPLSALALSALPL